MSIAVFKNETEYPIILESWKNKMWGLDEYTGVTVLSGETVEMISSVGEWFLCSLFYNKEHKECWENANLPFESCLAKFRTEPCYRGDYTWNYINRGFTITYQDGVFIWSRGAAGSPTKRSNKK